MTALVIDLANRRSLNAAYRQIEEACADIRRIVRDSHRIIDAHLSSIERSASEEWRRPSDSPVEGA